MGHGWPVPAPPPPPATAAHRRRRRRRRIVVAGLLAVGLLGIGLAAAWLLLPEAYVNADWREVNRDAVRRAGPVPAYVEHDCPFRAGEAEVACGTLLVPLDRDDPDAATIELAVARIAATGQDVAPDPVVYLEGGPGGFAVADHWWWPEQMGPVLERRDVILVDQRGVGFSAPTLFCTELWEGVDGDDDPDQADLEAIRACHDRLVAEGNDLAAYSTPAIAADVADLRRAMDLDEVNLLGVSYGTRVALAVLRDHPDGVRSVVLDSVFPMEVRALEEQVVHAAAAIDVILDRCAAQRACAADHPDLAARLDAAVEALNAAPVAVRAGAIGLLGGTEMMTGDDLVDAIFDALYAPDAPARVPPAIEAAAAGDMATAVRILDASDQAPGKLRWADEDSDGLFYSVTCREDAPVSDPATAARRARDVREPLSSALAADVQATFAACSLWGSGQAAASEAAAVRSDVPALVLAGEYDPITPAAWGRQTAGNLSAATYVEFPLLGHAVLAGGACPVGLITAFLDAPTGALDARCAAHQPAG